MLFETKIGRQGSGVRSGELLSDPSRREAVFDILKIGIGVGIGASTVLGEFACARTHAVKEVNYTWEQAWRYASALIFIGEDNFSDGKVTGFHMCEISSNNGLAEIPTRDPVLSDAMVAAMAYNNKAIQSLAFPLVDQARKDPTYLSGPLTLPRVREALAKVIENDADKKLRGAISERLGQFNQLVTRLSGMGLLVQNTEMPISSPYMTHIAQLVLLRETSPSVGEFVIGTGVPFKGTSIDIPGFAEQVVQELVTAKVIREDHRPGELKDWMQFLTAQKQPAYTIQLV